jgi:hypothetical protein
MPNSHFDNNNNNGNAHWESAANHLLSLECRVLPPATAAELVHSSPTEYFYAQNQGEHDCLLYRWVAVFPICGAAQPVNVTLEENPEETADKFNFWALQTAMPGVIKKPSFIIGTWEVPDDLSRFECMECGHSGYLSSRIERYSIDKNDDNIILKYYAHGRLYKLPKRGASRKRLCRDNANEDALSDTITFHVATGMVTEAISENGITREYDITIIGSQGWFTELYRRNAALREALQQAIGAVYDSNPDAMNLSLTEIIRGFRFRGYPESFIQSFPNIADENDQLRFHNSMMRLPLQYVDIAEVFSSLGLPQKSRFKK